MEETVEIEFTKDELTERREKAQFERMTKTPIPRLIVSLGIPTMLNMMVTSLYNMADTLFVSRLGEQAVGAVSVVLSLMSIIQAIGFTLGMGSGAIVSRLLGKRKQKEADEVFSTAFYTALAIGLVITAVGLVFLEPVMRLLGAMEETGVPMTTLEYSKVYATYILIAAPFMCMSFVMNNVLRAQGKAVLSMLGLIYGVNMGMAGAAVATMISQIVSFCILLFLFSSGKTITRIRLKAVARRFSVYGDIFSTGFPSFCRQILASICTALLNNTIAALGIDGGQAAFGIVQKVFMFAFSISLGIGQGYQPVLGYNYSAKRYDRVRSAYLFTLWFSVGLMLVFAITCGLLSGTLMNVFLDSEQARVVGKQTLLFQCFAMPLLPINFMAGVTYQVVGNRVAAAFLSCSRQGLFYIPLIFVLPTVFKVAGLTCLQAVSDVCSFLFALPFTFAFMRKLKRLQNGEEE